MWDAVIAADKTGKAAEHAKRMGYCIWFEAGRQQTHATKVFARLECVDQIVHSIISNLFFKAAEC